MLVPMCRPPTFLYSTRSGPRPAYRHSAAQSCTSPSRSPISAGPGPRTGTGSGAHSRPAAKAASRSGHFFRTVSRTSPGRVHRAATSGHRRGDLLAEGMRDPPGVVLLDGERLQPGVLARRVVDAADRRHVGLDYVDLLERGDDQQLQPEPPEQLKREPGRLIRSPYERLVDDREPERP